MDGVSICMPNKVQKGYSPQDMEDWEEKERSLSLQSLGLVCSAFIPLALAVLLDIQMETNPLTTVLVSVVSFTLLFWGFALDHINSPRRQFRNKVCKALAGLELGVYHCADDLVINLDMDWDSANAIIDGQYDNWLKHTITCEFMPN